jgi:hypothetical protein
MKQYLLSIYMPDEPPPPDVMARMDQIMANVNALVDEAKTRNVWVFNGALHAPTTATTVRFERGEALMTDGPYTEGKEHIGGFLIVEAANLDDALDWGRRLASVLGDGANSLPVEVRPFRDDTERN